MKCIGPLLTFVAAQSSQYFSANNATDAAIVVLYILTHSCNFSNIEFSLIIDGAMTH